MRLPCENTILTESLAIPGLFFRHVGGEDAQLLFEVHEQCADCDQVDRVSSIEYAPTQDDLTRWLADVVKQKQTHNWLIAQVGDTVVGYSRILWWEEHDGT